MAIKTFFGLPLYETLSDEEYVEKRRKQLRKYQKLGWLFLAIGLLQIALLFWFWGMLSKLATNPIPGHDQAGIWVGIGLGILPGFIFGHFIKQASESIIQGFNFSAMQRSDRLMVEYHDLLQEVHRQKSGEKTS